MNQSNSHRYDAVSHLLSRTALLALEVGLDEEAENLFSYQRRVLADPAALDVARAIVLLKRKQPEEAVSILRVCVLAEDPNHGAANAVLGFALQQAGLPGARECFERVLAASLDEDSREAALEGLAAA